MDHTRLTGNHMHVMSDRVDTGQIVGCVAPQPDAPPRDYDDGLLRVAVPLMASAYGAALAIAAFTFATTAEATFMIAICGVYTLMYFGVPIIMARIRTGRDDRWTTETPARRAEEVEIFAGTIGRREALLQMVIVPIGVALAFAAFSVLWITSGG